MKAQARGSNTNTRCETESRSSTSETVLEEAERIITKSRRNSYGHPLDNWTDTAEIWSVLLRKKLREPITADEAVLMMIGVKLAREAHAEKRDNPVDIAGYARCLEMLKDERERRKRTEA